MSDTPSDQIFTALSTVFPDSVLQPGSGEYEESNNSYFSAFESDTKPSYIVAPGSVGEVQVLVKVLRPLILSGDCRVAIRGAGHNPVAGSANIHGGVTVDLRGLKGILLSDDQTSVKVGSGEIWGSVYSALQKKGLTTAGARDADIGVSGFLLGGGLSMFSSRTGFSCDSVLEFEVVLASGEVVRANANENADLWFTLKGGLNNFGIVTSFTVKTFKSGDIWGGLTYLMPETFPQLLRAACDYLLNETDDDTHVMSSIGYGFGQQAATCIMWHTKGKENPPSLQRFTALGPQIKQMCTMRTSTHLDFCEELSKFAGTGLRQYWASITIKADVGLMETFHKRWEATVETIKDAERFTFALGFHPLSKSLLENSAKAGGNAMLINPSDGPLFVVLINPVWKLRDDDERIVRAVGGFVDELRQLAGERGLLHRYIFTNYACKADDIMASYGEESLVKLKAASKKYDPEGVFQQGVPGGFKLNL